MKLLHFVWPFKCHIPAAAIELFNLNTQCRTMFPLSDKKAVDLMEPYCPICPLKVKNYESVEITNKMQPCNRIYYSKIYWRLNMFRAAYRLSSGAPNCICSLWFIYPCGDRSRLGGVPTQPGQQPVTTWVYKPEAANTVWSSWWWAVCCSKHVEPSINFEIINSITRLHLVGYFYWFM